MLLNLIAFIYLSAKNRVGEGSGFLSPHLAPSTTRCDYLELGVAT